VFPSLAQPRLAGRDATGGTELERKGAVGG